MNASAENGPGNDPGNGPKEIVTVMLPPGSSALERSGIQRQTRTMVLGIVAAISVIVANVVGCNLARKGLREEANQCGELTALLKKADLSEAEEQRLCTMELLRKCLPESNFCAGKQQEGVREAASSK